MVLSTGIDLSKILGGANGGNNWWKHGRFSIIEGMCPDSP